MGPDTQHEERHRMQPDLAPQKATGPPASERDRPRQSSCGTQGVVHGRLILEMVISERSPSACSKRIVLMLASVPAM